MAKSNKHLKRLKSEKAKVKLKAKKSVAPLPKGLNITDTSFKIKKIVIREQLRHKDETEILSAYKLDIKDLLTRLRHYNSTVREEALKQLKDILLRYPVKSLRSKLNSLLCGVVALSLDREKTIRRNSLNILSLILSRISNEQLIPFHKILISYLSCSMTHIDPRVKEDSLLFLNVLLKNCENILAKSSRIILPNFLGMICRLHSEIKPGMQLTMTLDSKSTSVKWRIKVLECLCNMFTSVVNYKKLCTSVRFNTLPTMIMKEKKYIPVYGSSSTQVCDIHLDDESSSVTNCMEETLPVEKFIEYVDLLMPLIFDIWLEVCPNDKVDENTEITISSEAAALLKNIVKILQLIIEYIDMLNRDNHNIARVKHWIKDTFHNAYMKNFMSRFPYSKVKQPVKSPKKHQDFCQMESMEECLDQNLGLCQIQIWFMSLIGCDKQLPEMTKNYCVSTVKFLNDSIENWCDSSALPQLTKLLRTLFLKANPICYANGISLNHTLRLIMKTSSNLSKKELHSHLFLIIGDILLEHNLDRLHREKVFRDFVTTLPSLLLKPSIDDATIRMMSQIVLRFKEWIAKEMITKHEAIIGKKILCENDSERATSRTSLFLTTNEFLILISFYLSFHLDSTCAK